MDVTLLDISTDFKPSQNQKAYMPIAVTPLGMVMEAKPLQPRYLQVVLYQRFAC